MAFSNWPLVTTISGLSLVLASVLCSGTSIYAQGMPPGPQGFDYAPTRIDENSVLKGGPKGHRAQFDGSDIDAAATRREARIVFAGDTLAIHADNSSLTTILRQFAAKSGMKIEGLGGDERVFGTFGPGAPRDVLADLLHGTTYNLILLGDLGNGAPRELILTPLAHGGGGSAAPAEPPPNPDEANTDASNPDPSVADQPNQEPEQEPQGPLDLPTPVEDPPPAANGNGTETPGVKTPQQLFEQLQQMRQNQQNAPQGTQQDPPLVPQQDSQQ